MTATVEQAVARKLFDRLTNGGDEFTSNWRYIARPKQLPPGGDWRIWLILAGRGFGKTRTGAETVLEKVREGYRRIALVAPIASDARDVMVEGESGLLASDPSIKYEPSKRRLTWPNGAIATTYSADEPNRLRGPNHDFAWCDELAAWRHPEAFDMLLFGLRIGSDPRVIVTTTPRAIPVIRDLVKRDGDDVHLTVGSTFENADNLAPQFLKDITSKYEGTRLGRQELYAEILSDVPGALWTRDMLEATRETTHPNLVRVVVGVDPEASDGEDSASTGIVAAGVDAAGEGYVLDDATIKGSPQEWARQVVATYHKHRADLVAAEVNNGGDMVIYTIQVQDERINTKKLHASRGKYTRAEPVAALYEQGKVHHVGYFGELEDQLCTWVPGEDSPDRLDALVWSLTELMLPDNQPAVVSPARTRAARSTRQNRSRRTW